MYKNLLSYISELESINELIRVREFVNPEFEIAEIADRMAKSTRGGKALLFENTGTAFPVLINMYGSPVRILLALGLTSYDAAKQTISDLFTRVMQPQKTFRDKLNLLPIIRQAAKWSPKIVGGKGECQAVVMQSPDLSKLPILKCWTHDGGRFITLPMVHTKDHITGARNVGMYRMQVFSGNTTGMHWHCHKTGARHFSAFAADNKKGRFPVAVTLGGDPVYGYCATAPLPDNVDEYLLAGFLRKRHVCLVRCLTQPLEVPSDVDFVIEGYIDANEPPIIEGPFGDHTGFYSLEDYYPMLHVTCITHRKDAVYPATLVGIPPQEDAYLSQATEHIFLEPIHLALSTEIIDIHMPAAGVAHNLVIVKIKKEYVGQAIKVAHTLWGAGQMMFNKILIIVDGDVNIRDYQAVLHHMAQHYCPDRDTYFSKGTLDILDHSAESSAFGGKLCIDATHSCSEYEHGNVYSTRLLAFAHKGNNVPNARIVALFDEHVDLHDFETCIWLLGCNIDAVRDCVVANGRLVADATSKTQQIKPRKLPNITVSSVQTISSIDNKWSVLGLGEYMISPSRKYSYLARKGGAVVSDGNDGESTKLYTAAYNSPVGWLMIVASDSGVRVVEFCDHAPVQTPSTNSILQKCISQMDEYFIGSRFIFDLPLELEGSDFQITVWNELMKIPFGKTISYIELARRIGDAKAVRAVGKANGLNKISIIIPCHRVIGANGKLIGYAGGLPRKEWLLRHEQQFTANRGLFTNYEL